ncbi:DNA polymerase III subunit chi [Hydromonas duriensis]|uniref:DNA polymerase III chi subunit n=1 Tax=Hydromonas duriensis TaxID=1527608 RepID=A0A4R6Y8H6_9BURK|nr:DNA polymerase III subunit chi [Hydromonas duriensis]TDR31709.1 DNA polymerase III chi subunit [Hydromonas duriensis]
MTKIDFFSNAPNRIDYVARLLAKVQAAQQTAVVYGDAPVLSALSDALWHQSSFLAHDIQPKQLSHCASLVLMMNVSDDLPHHDVLINLSDETPHFFARFNRLIEVVPNEDTPKQAARERWGFYKSRGYLLTHHDIAAKRSS